MRAALAMNAVLTNDAEFECQVDMQKLEALFSRHMRARALLRSVVQAEKEALEEIVWSLKAVAPERRQEAVATCVARAAQGLVPDTGE